ncbi:MAG: hypothetical protein CM15mV51_1520 [uncultured marine virus]|nr:MAG: hypothetical protein CM15mV51_1520 [uncultured marine virus]
MHAQQAAKIQRMLDRMSKRKQQEKEIMAKTARQKSLDRWTKQKWRTPSGKKSSRDR